MKKHIPVYNVTVRYSTSSGNWKTLEISAPFTRWFDADGYFVAKPFQQWLASEVPVIGQADPKNATNATGDASAIASGVENDAATMGQSIPRSAKKTTVDSGTPGAKARTSKRSR